MMNASSGEVLPTAEFEDDQDDLSSRESPVLDTSESESSELSTDVDDEVETSGMI